MPINEKKLRQILSEHQEQTERYLRSFKEHIDHKMDMIIEYIKSIPAIK